MNELKLLIRKDIFILVNNILLILRNPLRLLPYAGVLAYFSFFYFRGRGGREMDVEQFGELQDVAGEVEGVNIALQNMTGILTLLALAFFVFRLYKATEKNVTFFSMADVNFLFTAPVKPSRILVYYMVRSLIPSLGGSLIFVLYSTAQLNQTFDLTVWNLTAMMLGLGLFFFILSPLRFLIYTFHTKYDVLGPIKTGIVVLGIGLGLMIIVPGVLAERFFEGAFSWIGAPWFDYFPFVGWSRGILMFLGHESWIKLVVLLLVYAVAYVAIVKLVLNHAGMYYEDVLESTESKEEIKQKAKGKQEASESTMSLNARKELDLPSFGQGAVALYWRNYVHSSRLDFHPIIGIYTSLFAGVGILLAILSRVGWVPHYGLYIYMATLFAFYFIAGMTKTSVGDLKKPFFILIPASWAAKFWNILRLDIYQTLVFAWMMVLPSVLIGGYSLGLILLFPLCLLAFYLTGLSISLVSQVGFEEGWDRKLIKPLIIGGVIFFGIFPAFGVGIMLYAISKQFVFGLLAGSMVMALVAGVMLHVMLDILERVELKEV
ncbi:putative ABC exporter domain-containing protein [Pleomorphovibrio marinus]|uniref:putative ABC exporter domain-containing protein n=1 Tax=Pleomorphovibrio marinus TaxID=2164132 RepID=UPI000E0C28B9|nr:putative ABC exporter domain-containing protein [Pleomorphovibrio marinus]